MRRYKLTDSRWGVIVELFPKQDGTSTPERPSSAAASSGSCTRLLGYALGRSRGDLATKIHLVCDAAGVPLAAGLSAGQRHDASVDGAICSGAAFGGADPRTQSQSGAQAPPARAASGI